jgi:hypothetical protein
VIPTYSVWPPGTPPWWFPPVIKTADLLAVLNYYFVLALYLRTLLSEERKQFSLAALLIIFFALVEMHGASTWYSNLVFVYWFHEAPPTFSVAWWPVRLYYCACSLVGTGGLIVVYMRKSWGWPFCVLALFTIETVLAIILAVGDAHGWGDTIAARIQGWL